MFVINALKEIAYTDNHLTALVKFLTFALENFGFRLTLEGCFYCEKQIDGRIFFDYRNGAFLCEKCFNGEGREVSITTYRAMQKAIEGTLTDSDEGAKKALKLLDYYITNRAEENLNSLKELIKIF